MWVKVKTVKELKASDVVRYTSNEHLKCNLGWIGGDLIRGSDNYRAIDNISKYGRITMDDNWLCQDWKFSDWDHWEKWVPNKDEKQKIKKTCKYYNILY